MSNETQTQGLMWKLENGKEYEEVLDEVVNAVLSNRKGVLKIEYSHYVSRTCCVKGIDDLEITYDPNGKLTCKGCDEGTMSYVHYYHQDNWCGEHVYGVEHHVVIELWVDQVTGIDHRDEEDLKEGIKNGLGEMIEVITDNADHSEDAIDIAQKLSDALQGFFYTETKGMELELSQSAGPDCPGMNFDMYFYG